MKTVLTRLLAVLLTLTVGFVNAQTVWHPIQTPTNQKLNTIQFVNNLIGFVGGDSILLKTVDGGANWAVIPTDSIQVSSWQGLDIYDMHWFSEDHGIIISGAWGGVFETLDGGLNWTDVATSNGGFCQTTSLFFFDEVNGFAGGAGCFEGHIIERLSGGVWSTANDPQDFDTQNWVASIEFMDELNGLAGTLNGIMLRTTDGGVNWDSISSGSIDTTISDFIFYPEGTIRATHREGGSGGVMISNDGGLTWTDDTETFTFSFPRMHAGHLAGNGKSYIGGASGFGTIGVIYESGDVFWHFGNVEKPINDITSHSDSITFLVGDSGAIYVNVELATLTVEDAQQVEFGLSPNPAIERLHLSGLNEALGDYTIVDMKGRTILASDQAPAQKTYVDVSTLNAGSYFISIETDSGIGTKRFLKL